PKAHPPTRFRAIPHLHTLPPGMALWRVHDRRYKATDFNPREADANFDGGRFGRADPDPDPAHSPAPGARAALAEALLRAIPLNGRGFRPIPRSNVRNRRASVVNTTEELTLVDLCSGEAQAAVAQDPWLVQAEPADYHATRRWASWIREQAPAAQGLIWPS